MKPLLLFAALALVASLPSSAETRGPVTDIRGVITAVREAHPSQVSRGTRVILQIEGAKESNTSHDRATVTITAKTKIVLKSDGGQKPSALSAFAVGQKVEARFTGPILESYPVQATAESVTILDSK